MRPSITSSKQNAVLLPEAAVNLAFSGSQELPGHEISKGTSEAY